MDALSRPIYKDVIIESLKYCQGNKGLILHAFVIMNNHVHLIASAKEEYNLSDILRDLKKHTSKTLLEMIENDDHTESRRNWMLWLFESAGKKNSNNKTYQFWQQDNHPISARGRCCHRSAYCASSLLYLIEHPQTTSIAHPHIHQDLGR